LRPSVHSAPLVAVALVVLLLGLLLWLLHRAEVEERQNALIEDMLWVEQDLSFHLSTLSERLGILADGVAQGGVEGRALFTDGRPMVVAFPELRRLIVRDAEGRVAGVQPPAEPLPPSDHSPDWYDGFTLARSLGRQVLGAPFRLGSGRWAVEAHMPVYRGGRFVGTVSAVITLESLLAHQVPWWFARRYRIEIADTDGTTLAAKSQLALPVDGESREVRIEALGPRLAIVARPYRVEAHLGRNLLVGAIIGLALAAVLSLWTMRRHLRHRLAAEQALRAEHSFRKAMEDSLTVGMRARDLEGRITYVNPAFCRMVGWSADELIGARPPMPYWAPDHIETITALHNALLRGNAPDQGAELMLQRSTGERFKALIYESPLIDADGHHTGWMASFIDITERDRVETLIRQQTEKLQRTARLITMGEMASTLAHELNQPLSAIASYATGCLNRLAGGEVAAAELAPPLSKIGAQAQRAGQIIRRIHEFVRKSKPAVVRCDLIQVIEGAAAFVDEDCRRHGIRVQVSTAGGALPVEADRILIEQVLLNLARNAMEAMALMPPGRRVIDITVRPEAGAAVVRVADCGGGIGPETEARLFTPFFSTKAEGMGMGLNICRSIVESHCGRLWFEPNSGGGSIFAFALPVIEDDA